MRLGLWLFLPVLWRKQLPKSCRQKQRAEDLPQYVSLDSGGNPCGYGGTCCPRQNRRQSNAPPQPPLTEAEETREQCGWQEEKQVDALGTLLVHPQKQGHHQQQQSAAPHAPGGEDARSQSAEKWQYHSRYFTPA